MDRANGFVIYRGPSRYDGAPIVVVAVGFASDSANVKTGAMIQTYIIRSDVRPIEALDGADSAICGSCPFRKRTIGEDDTVRGCYVNVAQAPSAVYRTLRAGKYPDATPAQAGIMAAGRAVRLGTYGDPAAVPVEVWRDLTALASKHAGYTHDWRNERSQSLRSLCMASVETEQDAARAHAAGWRTFRVMRSTDAKTANEVTCPASKEGGFRTTCAKCGLCNGTGERKAIKSVAIMLHGMSARKFERAMLIIGQAGPY